MQKSSKIGIKRRIVAHNRDPSQGDIFALGALVEEINFLETPHIKSPLFVSYFTENTPYEQYANDLSKSLSRLKLPQRIIALKSSGSWVANTCLKSEIILKTWNESNTAICWVDADAEIIRIPHFVYDNPFDIAIVRRNGYLDISSFIYLGKSDVVFKLISRWVDLCRSNQNVWDQVLFTLAWYQIAQNNTISSLWLNDGIFRFPRSRLRDIRDEILYYPFNNKIRPFVNQKQASRQTKLTMECPIEYSSFDINSDFKVALKSYDFKFNADINSIFI